MNKLILNRVAIWQPKYGDEFTERPAPAGRTYYENNVAKASNQPMRRFAKNYTLGKGKNAVKFCLMMITFSDASAQIEAFLDATAKSVDIELARKVAAGSSFEYLDIYYKEGA